MWNIFKLINIKDLEAISAPDKTAVFELGKYGSKKVRFIKSETAYLIIFDDVVFCPGINEQNPKIKGDKCAMISLEGDIYCGFYEEAEE